MPTPDEPTTTPPGDATASPDTDTAPGRDLDPAEQIRRLQVALRAERHARDVAERQLNDAVAAARTEAAAEGRATAARELGRRLAGAEFRARSAGRLTDPTAALDLLDVTRLVDDAGEPDTAAIDDAVSRLVAAVPPPPPAAAPTAPVVPNGVRPDYADGDWLRQQIAKT